MKTQNEKLEPLTAVLERGIVRVYQVMKQENIRV